MLRRIFSPLLLGLLLASTSAAARAQSSDFTAGIARWELFGQAGWAESDVRSYTIGAQHAHAWQRRFLGASLRGYTEVTYSKWVAGEPGVANSRSFNQVGIAPVLRIQHPERFPGMFLDLGIGAYLITPIYQHRDKRFGSAYNFGDQIGVGMQLGRGGSYEVSVRVQHFSNGGIKQPNPGENFLQMRLLVRFAG